MQRSPRTRYGRYRAALAAGTLAALSLVALPGTIGSGSGPVWLAAQQATHGTVAYLRPIIATYRNHAYILTTRHTSDSGTAVDVTTNESGAWTTRLLSAHGPSGTYSGEFAALAIDASTDTLYAAWVYHKAPQTDAIGVWTRAASGPWQGPVDVAVAGTLTGQPSIAANAGKVYLAFTAAPNDVRGACDDRATHSTDVVMATNDGGTWSQPRNLTSCVADAQAQSFTDPRVAADESGGAYLVSLGTAAGGYLWAMEQNGTDWSTPVRITPKGNVSPYESSPALRGTYAIAASRGTVYVAYAGDTPSSSGGDVWLLTQSGAAWSTPARVSPPDPSGCTKWGLAVIGRAGRVAVSYVRGSDGYCHVVGTENPLNTPHLLVGTPGVLQPIALTRLPALSCGDTTLSSDGDLFRVGFTCGTDIQQLSGNLYYAPEFFDVVGPTTRLSVPATAAAPSVRLTWSAQDPTPGSGVAYYSVQVSDAGGPWTSVVAATRSTSLTYATAQAGHHYTFRVRARDKVNNWGPWSSASTTIQ